MENKIYPFKFLDSYTAEDKDFFFGREEEVKQLYQMIYQSDTLLLYGASGTGKTSLIQCGLASQFQQHDWLEVFVRRHNNINESLERALLEAGGKATEEEENQEEDDWLDDLMNDDAPTAKSKQPTSPIQHSLRNIYLQHFRPIYLIFDQFEELFILGDKTEQQQFIATIREILSVEQPVKLIFSIREEYLGSLYEFEKVVPELLRKKLRIDPMNLEKAKAVVLGATHYNKSIVNIQEEEQEAIAEKVFEKIKGKENTLTIQLPYLQVFLDKFYRHISKDLAPTPSTEATLTLSALNELGDINNILRDFLDEQIIEIAKERKCSSETIWKILSPFVTVDGTKDPISIAALNQQLPLIKRSIIVQVVQDLINKRIVRHLEDVELYEIAHDSLALHIAERRSDEEITLLEVKHLIKNQSSLKHQARELFSEKQLLFMTPFLSQIQLDENEEALIEASRKQVARDRKARRQMRVLGVAFTIATFIIISGFAFYSFIEKNKAESAQLAAQRASIKNERIVNAMDFYDDKYALAFNNGKYGFIDKEGNPNPHIKFEYDKGEPFNVATGLAHMQIKENGYYQEYLLDTTGRRYKLVSLTSYFNKTGASNTVFSNTQLNWLKKTMPKSKEQQSILKTIENLKKNNALARSNLMKSLDKDLEKLALDFSGIPAEDITSIIGILVNNTNIKNRVEILLFNNTYLEQLPPSIVNFKNLRWLDCSFTSIKSLPENLDQLEHLVHLDLDYSALTTFPTIIGELINLNYLNISGAFDTIPNSIGNLHLLNHLSISGNFVDFPASINQLQNLQSLNIDALLETIPQSIGTLKHLKKLSLRGGFEEIPSSLTNLQQLTSLYLNGQFDSIPNSIGTLKKLKKLNLKGQFDKVPASIGQLYNLNYLDLQGEFPTLPREIGRLKQLTDLYVLGILQEIPPSIGKLKNLERFAAEGQFRGLPESIGKLKNLTVLSIFGQLETLPQSIGNLTNLKTLDLGGQFNTIPESIGNLQNLVDFYVFGQLDTLPKSLGKLTKLRILKIEGQFKQVPPSIEYLQSLNELSLFGKFKEFPTNVDQLHGLKELKIEGNFDSIPPTIDRYWDLNFLVLKGKFSTVPDNIKKLSKIKHLELISPNLQKVPNLESFKKLSNFKCSLIKNKSYYSNKAMLVNFLEDNPYCKHSFVDEYLNPVSLDN